MRRLQADRTNHDVPVAEALLDHLIHDFLARREHTPNNRLESLLRTYHEDIMVDAIWVQKAIQVLLSRRLAGQVPRHRKYANLVRLERVYSFQWS